MCRLISLTWVVPLTDLAGFKEAEITGPGGGPFEQQLLYYLLPSRQLMLAKAFSNWILYSWSPMEPEVLQHKPLPVSLTGLSHKF
jgi:hypothetical protein